MPAPRPHTLLRPLVLAVAVLAVAGVSLARADGATPAGPSVTITPSDDGAARRLSLAALAASFDVHDATYTLRAADDSTRTVTVAAGISLRALLSAAGLGGDPFTFVEIPRPDGSSSAYVPAGRIGGAGQGPPVVWADRQGVHFLRPSDGDGDANLDDDFAVGDGALSLVLHSGELLEPRIQVSTVVARPREAVRFRASLAAGTLASGMQFQWYFDDGTYTHGADLTHRFAGANTYGVELSVAGGSADLTSSTTIVDIRVAAAPRKRSGKADGAGAALGGVVAGGSTAGAGASGSGGGGGGAGGTGAVAGGTVAPTHPTSPSAFKPPASEPPPAARRSLTVPATLRGRLVSGTLIASAGAALPLAGGGRAATTTVDRPLHVPLGVWVAIGLAALLGLGWALESRHTLPFWQP